MDGPAPNVKGLPALSVTNSAGALSTGASCNVGVMVSAPLANTAPIYIGDANVTTGIGIELQPGDREFIPVVDAKYLYAITTGTQSLRILTM